MNRGVNGVDTLISESGYEHYFHYLNQYHTVISKGHPYPISEYDRYYTDSDNI